MDLSNNKRIIKLCSMFFYIFSISTVMIIVSYLSIGGRSFDLDRNMSVLTGDGTSMLMHIKSIQENGLKGLYFNPRIGAPESGSMLSDTPGVDVLLALMFWTLNIIFHPSTIRLVYYTYILQYVLIALTMSYLLYRLGINPIINFVMSALYALGPYHFYRNINHLAIGNAITIPISILISLYLIKEIKCNDGKDIVMMAIMCFLLGIGCPYYVAFGFILFLISFITSVANIKTDKRWYTNYWTLIVVVISFALTRMPAFIINHKYGPNSEAFARNPFESEFYALKIIQMLLPVTYSRSEALKNITNTYNNSGLTITESVASGLGIVASIGFLLLCVYLVFSMTRKENAFEEWKLYNYLSLSVITFVVTSSVGGFGEIFNWLVTPQIRCYNRSSIVIMCICLIAIASLLNKLKVRAMLTLTIAVLIIGFLDQVPFPDFDQVAAQRENEVNSYTMYASFFDEVEDSLDKGAMVYQLPHMIYPESGMPIYNIPDYKLFMAYLMTDDIRWSYGGIRGRNDEATKLNIDNGMSDGFVDGIKNAGFSGVYIDINGYEDGGASITGYYNSLGLDPIVSGNGHLYFYKF